MKRRAIQTQMPPAAARINVSVDVDFERDFRGWTPQQIKAFMQGVSAVTCELNERRTGPA
jgi:hypothetical protein